MIYDSLNAHKVDRTSARRGPINVGVLLALTVGLVCPYPILIIRNNAIDLGA